MDVYGVICNGVHTDVSKSALGAKQYATRNGFNQVSVRYNGGYNAEILFEKINGVWQEFKK